MNKYLKESLLKFIVYVGTIGAIISIAPMCISPRLSRGRVSYSYFDAMEWIEFAGDVLFSIAQVLMIFFVMKKIKSDNYKKPSSTMLQAFIAVSILSCFASYFEITESSNDFWDALGLVYLGMLIAVGIFFLSNRNTKAIGIGMFCVVIGAIITLAIANPDNHNKWVGIATIAPYAGTVYFYLEACKRYLIGKPMLVEDEETAIES